MDKENLLLSKLMTYQESDAIPFHMPGHKRRTEYDMMRCFPNPYSIDITEIDGFDNLHHPEGILRESMEWAAEVYHADHTYYLINGSSAGILSAICSATHPGGNIMMSRNCHKSAYHGVILNGLEVEYIYPQILIEMGIQGGILAVDVEKSLKKGPLPEAVFVVSPTYDGIVSDIRAIAEVVHRYDIPLIVDEAHGAHFPFGAGYFPKSALDCGADVVIQSLHKTLPSFTQTAVLHVCGNRIDRERLERYLQIFQSSSPSYVLMAGIERCIYEMEQHGADLMKSFSERLKKARSELKKMKKLRLLEPEKGQAAVFDMDPSKIVVSCRGCSLTGEQLSEWLRKQFHLELEMSGADYVTAITTCFDREEDLDRLVKAFFCVDGQIEKKALPEERSLFMPISRMRPAAALEAKSESILLTGCADRISAEFVYLYPPGIPIVVPGEQLTAEIIDLILEYKKMELPVQGMADPGAEKLRVVCER